MDCEMFFEWCDENSRPYTITGLALALGTSRQTLMNYEHREAFFDTIKKHKTRVENYAEERLYSGNAAGPIFALKNFEWKDKQEVENSGKQELNITITDKFPEGEK